MASGGSGNGLSGSTVAEKLRIGQGYGEHPSHGWAANAATGQARESSSAQAVQAAAVRSGRACRIAEMEDRMATTAARNGNEKRQTEAFSPCQFSHFMLGSGGAGGN